MLTYMPTQIYLTKNLKLLQYHTYLFQADGILTAFLKLNMGYFVPPYCSDLICCSLTLLGGSLRLSH